MNHNKVCKTCGKHFFSKYVQKIYCSDFCAPSPVPFEKKPKIEKKCCVCSGTFLDWAKGQKKYCSEVCYENNSRSSFNLRVRFTVFKKHNFTCQYCGRKAPEVVSVRGGWSTPLLNGAGAVISSL